MKKEQKELLKSMSIGELEDVIYEKRREEAMKKYGTKRETEYKITEVEELTADSGDNLFHIVVADGSEGWEALVEVDRNLDWGGDLEKLVEDHIVNFMIENGYYENGDIDDITVSEICRYSRPIFRIEK